MYFQLRLDTAQVERALTNLANSMTPAQQRVLYRKVATLYISNTKSRFTYMNEPGGARWASLKKSTVDYKRRKGSLGNPQRIGLFKGKLVNSIGYTVQGNNILIGSNVPYAKTFQFGAGAGSFPSRSWKQIAIPWGDVPPRPFLGPNKVTNDKVMVLFNQFYSDAMKP